MTAIRLFVFGLGYSATAFVRSVTGDAASVAGTVRSPQKAAALRATGIDALAFDGSQPNPAIGAALRLATHVLISVPPKAIPGKPGPGLEPGRVSASSSEIAPDQGIENAADPVLAYYSAELRAAPDLVWIGYLSTVGVYGDYAGAWVREETTPHPRPGRSAERLAAEKAWAALAAGRGVPFGIFRLAGIYGPSRNVFLALAAGAARRIVKPGQVFNRIHVADIAATLRAAMARPASAIYNVADDEPAPPEDVVEFAARLMGAPVPPAVPFAEAGLTPMARSFYEANKRVSNRRLREDLGVALAYPTYREGLTALWRDGTWRE
jgi:hypothetical protein